jgi:hypothetical protein
MRFVHPKTSYFLRSFPLGGYACNVQLART